MIRKYHNHTLQPNPRHHEEGLQNINSHKTSVYMIAKLKRTHINEYQNKDLTRLRVHKTMNKQQQNHRLRTDSSLSHGGLQCILLAPNLRPRFCCC